MNKDKAFVPISSQVRGMAYLAAERENIGIEAYIECAIMEKVERSTYRWRQDIVNNDFTRQEHIKALSAEGKAPTAPADIENPNNNKRDED